MSLQMFFESGARRRSHWVIAFLGLCAVAIMHAGRQYSNLRDFANESDPGELSNEENNAIL